MAVTTTYIRKTLKSPQTKMKAFMMTTKEYPSESDLLPPLIHNTLENLEKYFQRKKVPKETLRRTLINKMQPTSSRSSATGNKAHIGTYTLLTDGVKNNPPGCFSSSFLTRFTREYLFRTYVNGL